MQKLLDKMVINLKETFQERLSSVFLYGSCAVEDCSKVFSDLNMIVIIKNLKAQDLKKAHRFSEDFAKSAKYLPIFMDKDEWLNSSDVYAIEYSDIIERHKILYGENLIENLHVHKHNLRLQCEHEVKNLLIRLRQGYLAKSNDKKAIKHLIQTSSKTFMIIFRTTLSLLKETVPIAHEEVVKHFCEKISKDEFDFDCDLFLRILEFRKNQKAIKDSELESIIEKLIDTTDSVLKYVDKIELN